ncbi:hypothetical protein G5V57_00890 [Nordella sp. HKS 07]|uniref:hypothetical protein n=1 Tax=Nordella sp. HKS 07 TaxID=2712222 RepID=UPI0013E1C2AD|nr:hypothetical protein [Nordella sp. HKS 07]QIG46436.1 hypothetical protein G5V57_00890 [Nordella sp. HKS 07]
MTKLRKTKRALLALAIFLAAPVAYIGLACQGTSDGGSSVTTPVIEPETRAKLDDLPGYRFPEEMSYLSFPEWYTVYTSQDFADYIGRNYPSGFSYFRSVGEFWTSYCAVNSLVAPRYEFSLGTHLMIYVIGIGHTVEYLVKGIYENTIGRLSEFVAPSPPTGEDLFARKYAHDYGQWLNTVPWYEFAFAERLHEFWKMVPFAGPGPVRKAERRFAVSAELGVKGAVGWLMRGGTDTAYEPAPLEIYALMRGLPPRHGADRPAHRAGRVLPGREPAGQIPALSALHRDRAEAQRHRRQLPGDRRQQQHPDLAQSAGELDAARRRAADSVRDKESRRPGGQTRRFVRSGGDPERCRAQARPEWRAARACLRLLTRFGAKSLSAKSFHFARMRAEA